MVGCNLGIGLVLYASHVHLFFRNSSGVLRRNHSVYDWVKFIWDDGEKTANLF
jgi:hypothetical protein